MNHYMTESHNRLQEEIFTKLSFSSSGSKIKGYHVKTPIKTFFFLFMCPCVVLVGWWCAFCQGLARLWVAVTDWIIIQMGM